MTEAPEVVTVSANGWTVTLAPPLAFVDRLWLEGRLQRARSQQEAWLAVACLRPGQGDGPQCFACSGRGWYWLCRYPQTTGFSSHEATCHSCDGTGMLAPAIVAIIGLLAGYARRAEVKS